MQIIYIDVLFFLNIMMDLFIFRIASLFLNHKVRFNKLIIGSVLAALFYCLSIIIRPLQQIPSFIYYLMIPIISILYMFKPLTLKQFIRDYMVCFVAAWGVGGIGFNLYYLALQYTALEKTGILVPIVSGGILWALIELSITWIRKQRIGLQCEYNMMLEHNGVKLIMKGFLDTGNRLYTLNHHPVTLVCLEDLSPLLSKECIDIISLCQHKDPLEVLLDKGNKDFKIYLVPFDSVGCKEGILIGIAIEKMILKKGTYENVLENCIVGVTSHQLFKSNDYNALIHPDFISLK